MGVMKGISPERLSGWSGSTDYFQFAERHEFDPVIADMVLRGELAGAVFRGFATNAEAEHVLERFRENPHVVARTGDAAGVYLGAYHYHKSTEAYLDDAAALERTLSDVLGFNGSPWLVYRHALASYFNTKGIVLRCAESHGRRACIGAVRSWAGRGAFALVPHEDRSQCRHPEQRDFEIQSALNYEVCATNLCLKNDGAGRLFYWNVKPDDETRTALGTFYDGGPYPADLLDEFGIIKLDINAGDLYIFNGSHVHAVEHAAGARTTAACIMGFIADDTVVTWT
jgi:hypothetical protein